MFVAGFNETRNNSQIALGLVEIMMFKSNYPCFSGFRYGHGVAIKRFERRLMLHTRDDRVEKKAVGLVTWVLLSHFTRDWHFWLLTFIVLFSIVEALTTILVPVCTTSFNIGAMDMQCNSLYCKKRQRLLHCSLRSSTIGTSRHYTRSPSAAFVFVTCIVWCIRAVRVWLLSDSASGALGGSNRFFIHVCVPIFIHRCCFVWLCRLCFVTLCLFQWFCTSFGTLVWRTRAQTAGRCLQLGFCDVVVLPLVAIETHVVGCVVVATDVGEPTFLLQKRQT